MNFPQSWRLNLLFHFADSRKCRWTAGSRTKRRFVDRSPGQRVRGAETGAVRNGGEGVSRGSLHRTKLWRCARVSLLAVALFEEHKFPESRQEFEGVRQVTGERPGISYSLGRLDLEERNYKGAIENLAKASALPPFPDTACCLGLAYLKQGSDADAEMSLKKDHAGESRRLWAEYQLATLLRKQGRQDEANQISRPRTRKPVATSRAS